MWGLLICCGLCGLCQIRVLPTLLKIVFSSLQSFKFCQFSPTFKSRQFGYFSTYDRMSERDASPVVHSGKEKTIIQVIVVVHIALEASCFEHCHQSGNILGRSVGGGGVAEEHLFDLICYCLYVAGKG